MEKTKLGLPVCVMVGATYLLAYFGGYTPLLLILGYIFLREEDSQLKGSAVSALALLLVSSVLNAVIGLLPDLVELFSSMVRVFNEYFYVDVFNRIANVLYNILGLAKLAVFTLLTVFALLNKPLVPGFIKKLLD